VKSLGRPRLFKFLNEGEYAMPVTYIIVTLFLKKARNSQEVADAGIDLEFVEYGMTNKLWEVEKTLYMGLIFLFIPFLNFHYYVVAVFLLMSIKIFTGGLHVTDTNLGPIKIPAVWHCFFWTLMTFITGTYLLLTLLPLNTTGKISLALVSIIITFLVTLILPYFVKFCRSKSGYLMELVRCLNMKSHREAYSRSIYDPLHP